MKTNFRIIVLAFLLCGGLTASPPGAHAQGGVPLWTNRYSGQGNSDNYAVAIAVDSSGTVFVTGYSSGNGTGYDYATVAYSNAGVPLWTNRYNGPASRDDYATAMAVDGAGNVFVTGYSDNGINCDYATVAYSGAGVPLWTNRYDGAGSGFDFAHAVAADNSGSVFVTGESWSGSSYDYTTIKYSGGGVPLWTNRYNGPGGAEDGALALAVDSGGNVLVTGSSTGTNGLYDYGTVAYSGAGAPLWTNRYDGTGSGTDYANAIAVDSSGNVFITGGSDGTNGLADYATVAYSNSGVPLWTNRYEGPGSGTDYANAIAVDSSGRVFVTGYSAGTNPNPYYAADYATVAYSGAGVPLWTNRYNGPADDLDNATAMGLDSSGNLFVTGSSTGTGSSRDYVTIAYSNTGMPLWTNRYNGAANGDDSARAMAVDHSGNVFVTGNSWNGSNNDYATIKYALIPPSLHFQRMDNQLVLSWSASAFGLQTAPSVTGVFTDIPGATSPYTNSIAGSQQFFRLRQN